MDRVRRRGSIGGTLFAPYFGRSDQIITPTIVLYEVYKKVKRERGEEMALLVAGRLNATQIVP